MMNAVLLVLELFTVFTQYAVCSKLCWKRKMKDVKRCACYAHIRRYFLDAVPKGSEKGLSNPAVQGVAYCVMTYLEDGRCSLSNNMSENSIRPVVVGRKNWLFSDTPEGAEASMGIYTIVEMSKLHGLDPYKYMKYVLEMRPDYKSSDEDLEKLAPWSDKVQNICR